MMQIGRIVKAQGLRGEVKMELETQKDDALENITLLYLKNERGDFYPVRINSWRTEFQSGLITFFVHFEQIADRSAAELLRNKAVYTDEETAKALIEPDPGNDLIDYEVMNEDNKFVGMVTDIMDSTAQRVLTVATTRGSLMIPVVDEYVTSIDEANAIIWCHNLNLLEDL